MFKVLKKFVGGQEKKRTLLESAMGVVKRDHLLAQLQAAPPVAAVADSTTGEPFAAETLAPEPMPEVVEAPAPQEAPACVVVEAPAPKEPVRKHSRAKKSVKKSIPEPAVGAFEFMAAIDLELKGAAVETVTPPETPGLPPDFEAKLQQLSKLMNFDDC